jgi:hypothetical protein
LLGNSGDSRLDKRKVPMQQERLSTLRS